MNINFILTQQLNDFILMPPSLPSTSLLYPYPLPYPLPLCIFLLLGYVCVPGRGMLHQFLDEEQVTVPLQDVSPEAFSPSLYPVSVDVDQSVPLKHQ